MSKEFLILETPASKDYELVDSGDGEKLERYGEVLLSRPDPQALWPKLAKDKWQMAQARFAKGEKGAKWVKKPGVPDEWQIELGGLKFFIKPTAFKHTGVFPEQVPNWDWMRAIISSNVSNTRTSISRTQQSSNTDPRTPNILNLFGYTGGATLAAAQAGAKVCHVDGSKVAITWAKKNAEISGLADKPIRWILDDARAFLKREGKRGHKYDGIIMDPPAYGHGPDGEMWKIEEHLLDLFSLSKQVLSNDPLFFLVNGYASGYSAIAYENNLTETMKKFSGKTEIGELTIKETSGSTSSPQGGRLLPSGIFARWESK